MSEAQIDDLLDELVAPFEPRPKGWEDVVTRARRARRRYVLLAAAIAALLLVPTGVALRGEIANLFQGTPAPPAVSSSFETNNRIADEATRNGFGNRYPHADVSKAHGVLEVQTSDGPEDLWVAPSDQGGQCWFVDFANDVPATGEQYGFGGCDSVPPPGSHISQGFVWVAPHPELFTLWGQVYVPATSVAVRLEDGSTSTLPVVEGFFLGSFDKNDRVSQITAYEASGDQVAVSRTP
jgi:hypothetical protein